MEHNIYKDDTYINSLVDAYKTSTSEELKLKVIQEFDPYFKKYAYLLCSFRPVDLTNKDTMKFFRLFMTDEDRATEPATYRAAKNIALYLRNLFRDYSFQDVYDQVVLFFLEQLNRYTPMIANHKSSKERISFTHFAQVNIRYRMAGLAKKRSRDAMYCRYNVEYIDEVNGTGIDSDVGENYCGIDQDWVRGFTSGEIFSQLDESERYFLYLKYESHKKYLSDYGVARMTGMDRMYIRRKMQKIKEKLEKILAVA